MSKFRARRLASSFVARQARLPIVSPTTRATTLHGRRRRIARLQSCQLVISRACQQLASETVESLVPSLASSWRASSGRCSWGGPKVLIGKWILARVSRARPRIVSVSAPCETHPPQPPRPLMSLDKPNLESAAEAAARSRLGRKRRATQRSLMQAKVQLELEARAELSARAMQSFYILSRRCNLMMSRVKALGGGGSLLAGACLALREAIV